ncbi:hypothetical protein EDB19DRAFT_1246458 [Suillus lakei]|nr:hypothetical protein EDB19DRAFT_1246458 [Suillus lakei]
MTLLHILGAALFCVLFVRASESLPGLNDTYIHTFDARVCPSCNTRTLWDIFSSCGLTLFACTWTAIHPNIPGVDIGLFWTNFHRPYLMMVALFAPELITAWAASQYLSACQAAKDFNDAFCAQSAQPHGDRRAIWQSKLAVTLLGDIPHSSRGSPARWTLTHGFFASMGGFVLYVDGEPWAALTPDELLRFVREGSVDMPLITKAEIEDRSKGDVVSKCVAILQLVWFVIQFIARYAQNLPVTLLEIDTLGVAALACIAYSLWWKKPKDVGRPYIVHWNSEATAPPPRDSLVNKYSFKRQFLASSFHPGYTDRDIGFTITPAIIGCVSGMVFGGIHCLGWNFLFPRHAEHILWRVASIGMVYPPLMVFFISTTAYVVKVKFKLEDRRWIWDKIPSPLHIIFIHFVKLFVVLSTNFYMFARVTTIVLMMLSLRSLPPGAYDTVAWTKFIPHLNL